VLFTLICSWLVIICICVFNLSRKHCFVTLRSKILHGIDPFLISCWACLSHDLHSAVAKQTSLSLSELLEHIHSNAKEIREAAALHKQEFVDAGVPIAPCLTNLLMPILQKNAPEKMRPRSQRGNSSQETLTTTPPATSARESNAVGGATAAKSNAVGGATAAEDEEDGSSLQTPSTNKRRRWRLDATGQPGRLKLEVPEAVAVVANAKATAKSAHRRLSSKTSDRHRTSRSRANSSIRPHRKRSTAATAKSLATRSRKSKASSQKGPKSPGAE
jgi:hypothetical protein